MADFRKAYQKTSINEGGYANHSSDRGGETYRGIARKFHPNWSGWKYVDEAVRQVSPLPNNSAKWKKINEILKGNAELDKEVESFYRTNFWNVIRGDGMVHQETADKAFDTAVWSGPKTAGEYLQRGLNLLNFKGNYWDNLKVDGSIGQKTLYALAECDKTGLGGVLAKILSILQGYHVISIMEKDESQEEFAVGWLLRG